MGFHVSIDNVTEALTAGADLIFKKSQEMVPKESGDLAASGSVDQSRGGNNAVAIVYKSVYARWIHEHLEFRHPHGGSAKFLEIPMFNDKDEAVDAIAKALVIRVDAT